MLATRPTRTFPDLARHVRAAEEKHSPEWSAGQTAVNVLWRVWPALAREIEGTDADPSRDDARLPAFWTTVADAYDTV